MADNKYDSLLDGANGSYGDLIDQQRKQSLQHSMNVASGRSPDVEAKLAKLAKQTGIPVEAIRLNQLDVEHAARVGAIPYDDLLKDKPATSSFLSQPDNAGLAHDDIDALSKMESTIGAIRGQSPSLSSYVSGVANSFVQGAKRAREGVRMQAADAYDALGLFSPQANERMRSDARSNISRANLEDANATPAFESSTARGIYGGVSSAARMLPGLAASVLTRSPAPVLASAGIQSETEAYGKYRARGASAGQALLGASGEAAVEVGTEMIPMGYLVNTFGKVGAGKFLTGLLAREVPSEQVATLAQDALDTAIANPDKTWGEYVAERPDAAYQTLLATVTQSAIFGGAHVTAHKIGHKMEQVQQAQQNADLMTALGQAATDSKLLARLPEKMREFIAKAKEGGPVADVLIPAEAFSTYFQTAGIDPALAAQEAGVKNYAEAMATGSDLSIPLEDYITSIARTEHHNALVQDMRFHPGEMTLREAANFEQNRDEIIQSFMDSTGEAEQDGGYNAIHEAMMGQLVGRFDRGTAESYATLYAKGITTLAERAGMDPLALHEKYGLSVNSPLPDVLTNAGTADIGIDPLLERLRAGDVPTDEQIFGERLTEFVRKNGGLTDEGGDLRAMDADKGNRPFQKNLIQLTGMHPDRMRQIAAEEGFLSDDTTTADFLDLLDQDLNGGGAYRQHGANAELLGLRELLGHIDDFLRNSGLDLSSMTNEQVRAAMEQASAQPAGEATQYDQGTEGRAAERRTRTIEVDGVRRPITNSRGQLIAPDFAGQMNFWKWFGNSQWVDEAGQPLVLHHGSANEFTEFDIKKVGTGKASGNDGYYGMGFYATPEQWRAGEYGPNVQDLYLRSETPFVMNGGDPVQAARELLKLDGFTDDQRALLEEHASGALEDEVMLTIDMLSQVFDPAKWAAGERADYGAKLTAILRAGGFDGVMVAEADAEGLDEYMVFDPEQVKSAVGNSGKFDPASPNILFQSEADVRDLIVTHNLTASNLLHANKMGGIAVPSLAITKNDTPLGSFGEITLMGSRDMADPKGYAKTQVFGADIYSPRYPSVEHEIDGKAKRAFDKKFSAMAERLGVSMPDTDDIERKAQETIERSLPVMAQFVADQGMEPTIVARAGSMDAARLARLEKFGLGPYMDKTSVFDLTNDPAFVKAAAAEMIDAYRNSGERGEVRAARLEKDEEAQYNMARDLAYKITADAKQRQRPEADKYATQSALEKQIAGAGLASKYQAYVADELAAMSQGERIFKGFSNSGKRQYTPHTLENVVKILKKELRGGENFNYGVGSLRAKFTPQFKTVAQIKKEKGRLVSAEQFEQVRKEIDDEFIAVGNAMKDGINMDTTVAILEDAPTMGLERAAAQYQIELSDEAKQKAAEFLTRLHHLPTEYFEAKILRDVSIAEFSGAIVPEGSSPEVLKVLADNGVTDIRFYKEGDDASRAEQVQQFERLFFQKAEDEKRGFIQFGADRKFSITLLEKADLSTVVHEFGHFWLEVLGDLASEGGQVREAAPAAAGMVRMYHGGEPRADHTGPLWFSRDRKYAEGYANKQGSGKVWYVDVPEAHPLVAPDTEFGTTPLTNIELPAELASQRQPLMQPAGDGQIAEDYQTLLAWFKVENRDGIAVEHHEQFARGFEAYLMEGKAPSAELRGVFQRFKAWMTLIYKKLSGLNVKLNDDVRAVFDRILASEDEIKNAAAEMGQVQIFATAADAGMTESEFAAYSKTVQAASTAARETLEQKLMREYSRAQKAWYKDERAKVKAEVDAEVSALPVYLAFEVLTGGKAPDGSTIKLNKADLVERYGAEYLKKLPRSSQRVYAVEGGYAVDLAAEVLGFDSADSLVESLVNMRPKKALIEAETDARMIEKHGDMRFDGTIADEALGAVHNEERATVLAAELRALRRKAREVRQVTNALDREDARQRNAMMDSVPPLAAIRSIAAGQIGQKQVRDLTPALYLTAEKKAARQAFELAAKGQYQEAAIAKQRELLNHYLYREAVKAQAEVEAIRKHAADLQKPSAQQRFGKAGADYLDQINGLLERYEFKRVSGAQLDRRASLKAWYDKQVEQGFAPAIAEDLLEAANTVNFKQVPVDELRAVRDALSSIEHLAGLKNKLLAKGKKIAYEDGIAELIEAAEKNASSFGKGTPFASQRSGFTAAGDWASNVGAELLQMEAALDVLDGQRADGPWHRFIFNQASDSQTAFLEIMGKIGKNVQALVEAHSVNGKMDDKFATPLSAKPITRYELISIALNVGNAANYDKLLRGMNWQPAAVEAALARLNGADWQFVQAVWDEVNGLWPEIAALEKRLSGVEPEKVEARPYQIRDSAGNITHEVRGGYYPLAYDARHSAAGVKQETGPLAGLTEAGYVPATTPRGHTKARTTFAAPLLLDFGQVLQKHLTGVVKDLTHREFLIDANKIFNDQRIRALLQERLGDAYEKQFMPWLKGIANDGGNDSVGPFGKFFEKARASTTTVALGLKVGTMMVQAAGVMNSIEYVGAGWMMKGLRQAMSAGPLYAFRGPMLEKVLSKSGEMRHRFDTLDRDIRDRLRAINQGKGQKAFTAIERAAFMGIGYADRMVTIPTWLGQYEKALSQGMAEAEAIHAADGAVRRSQGSGGAKDLSQFQRRGGAFKLFSMFMTPFGAQFGRMYKAKRDVDQKGAKYAPQAIMQVLMVTAIPAVLADLIAMRGPDECSIDDPACYAKWAAVKGAFAIGAPFPLLREVGNYAERYINGKAGARDISISPVVDMFGKLTQSATQLLEVAFGEREFDEKLGWDLLENSGYVLKLPTAQFRITVEYLSDLLAGEEEPENPGELLHDMAFRRKEKDK
jgi:hypothetical protein